MRRAVVLGIVLALGALAAPSVADAQPAGRIPRIGVLADPTLPTTQAFRQGLLELGYVEGRTVLLLRANAAVE